MFTIRALEPATPATTATPNGPTDVTACQDFGKSHSSVQPSICDMSATGCDKLPPGAEIEAATSATPATTVATVAMSQVAETADVRLSTAEFRQAIITARDDASLEEFRAALVMGSLVACCNCIAFRFADDPAGLGHCVRLDTEAWPFAPFSCDSFEIGSESAAPAFVPDPDGGRARSEVSR
jgi:hypothetical protein